MAPDPYKYFRVEARELIEQLSRGLLDLEKSEASANQVARLLRAAHTLKGAARVVRQSGIADQAHAIEDTLIPFRDSAEAVPREQVDRLLVLVDQMVVQLGQLEPAAEAAPARASTQQAIEPSAAQTVRADLFAVDGLLEGISETHIQISLLRRQLPLLEQASDRINLLVEQANARRRRAVAFGTRLALERSGPADSTRSIAEDVRAILERFERQIASSLNRMERELRGVRESAEQLRLAPAGTLLTSLERSARDAAQLLKKSVAFESAGQDVRLDAHVLEGVQGALHQLVRNAVAHGIELPAVRAAAGKPPAGLVRVAVTRSGQRLAFSCQDDGAGVDMDTVRRAAERRGLLPPDTQELGADELLRLLLHGGLSTSGTLTQVAGRGIGMDMVRDAVASMGGQVRVQTARGEGTTITLDVPASLLAMDALVVESGGGSVGIPLEAVRHTLRIDGGAIAADVNGESITYDGRVIPFVPLAHVLHGTQVVPGTDRTCSAVVVQSSAGEAAVGVERLVGTTELVLRPMPKLVPPMPLVAGASLDAEGNAQIVLDPQGLVRFAQTAGGPQGQVEVTRRPLLVVDDSLTTRMLEKSILEAAGFEVDVATSGEEGLEAAARRRYALFLVDVDMPGMDGFTFIERYRADPSLRDIPSILVTSREAPEDRRRGDEVGASGYMIKADFNQVALLERIRQLIQ